MGTARRLLILAAALCSGDVRSALALCSSPGASLPRRTRLFGLGIETRTGLYTRRGPRARRSANNTPRLCNLRASADSSNPAQLDEELFVLQFPMQVRTREGV